MAPHAEMNGLVDAATNGDALARRNPQNRGWIVQKFGGTSVGKFPAQIAERIVGYERIRKS
jgi:hypothetical protein